LEGIFSPEATLIEPFNGITTESEEFIHSYQSLDETDQSVMRNIFGIIVQMEMEKRGLSIRKLAQMIEQNYSDGGKIRTPHYNTLQQIKSRKNYTIDNLLMLLDSLDKKIVVVEKTQKNNKKAVTT